MIWLLTGSDGPTLPTAANGCIHRFTPAGQWEKCFTGFGQATWIAIDCRDRIYVIVAGPPAQVVQLDADGNRVAIDSMPGELTPLFPRNSISVDAEGLLHLGAFCAGDAPVNCQSRSSLRSSARRVKHRSAAFSTHAGIRWIALLRAPQAT